MAVQEPRICDANISGYKQLAKKYGGTLYSGKFMKTVNGSTYGGLAVLAKWHCELRALPKLEGDETIFKLEERAMAVAFN